MIRYEKVHYDPLSFEEAKDCVLSLIEGIHVALREFHEDGIVHYDVRLPNVCFSRDCKAVLTDLEMCKSSVLPVPSLNSCMYIKSNTTTKFGLDFVVLGWLVVDVFFLILAVSVPFRLRKAV